jgi:hypothetical protein
MLIEGTPSIVRFMVTSGIRVENSRRSSSGSRLATTMAPVDACASCSREARSALPDSSVSMSTCVYPELRSRSCDPRMMSK